MSDRNPVAIMDSVDAMDRLNYAHYRLKLLGDSPRRLAEIKECELKHKWALRKYLDASFDREDAPEPEPKKKLTAKKQSVKLNTRRSK